MSPIAMKTRPRVFALDPLDPEVEKYARTFFDLTLVGQPGFEHWREEADALMVRSATITAGDVARFSPGLRFISKHGVGLDRIDLVALRKRRVAVMNTPGVNATAVAELALGLALALSRNIAAIDRQLRDGDSVTKAQAGLFGFQLTGKTLGLIGGGNVAFQLGRMFTAALSGKVIIYDPYISPESRAQWEGLVPPSRLTFTTLEEMLPLVDLLSVHVPLLDSTRNLLDYDKLRLMKSTALVINTARGGIISEPDLARALNDGLVAGAGIDAWSEEPPTLAAFPLLIGHPRVLSTPHIGAACPDVIRTTGMSVVDHLREALAGEPRDVVQ